MDELTPEPSAASASNIFDGWRSISIALYMALVGYSVMVGIPVLSTAWVELLGFTPEQVGRVAGADLGGLSLGAVLAALLVSRINRRAIVVAGVVLTITSNALCMFFVEYEYVLWLRVAAGIGAGIYVSVAVVSLGATLKPERSFNILLFAFTFSTALELYFLPRLSMDGIYLAFIGLYLLGLFFLHWVPARPLEAALRENALQQAEDTSKGWEVPHFVLWICLAVIFFTYANIGGYWTYIELASLADGIDDKWVGELLVWGSVPAVMGCLLVLFVSSRFGLLGPLMFSLLAMAIIVGMLASGINEANLMVSMFSFRVLWVCVDVFQMSAISRMDRKGSFVAVMPGAQGFGQIVGPNVAASLLGAGLGYGTVFLACGSMALIAMLLCSVVLFHSRRDRLSEVAGASKPSAGEFSE